MEDKNQMLWNFMLRKLMEAENDIPDAREWSETSPGGSAAAPKPAPSLCKPEGNSVRVYAPEERRLLSKEAIQYLRQLRLKGIIDGSAHEDIMEKVSLCSERRMGVEEVTIVASMVLLERDDKEGGAPLPYPYGVDPRAGSLH